MQERDLKKLMETLKIAENGTGVADGAVHEATDRLSAEQKSKMDALLRDPEKLKKLLDSPIAKRIRAELQEK